MKAISIFSILGLLTISGSAWGATGICDFRNDRNIVSETQNNVVLFGDAADNKDKVYFCTTTQSAPPDTISSADITRFIGNSRAVGNGHQGRATVPIGTTSVEVSGNLNTGSFREYQAFIRSPRLHLQFVTYHYYTQQELDAIPGGQVADSSGSTNICYNDGRWQRILNYLQANPQIFVVNDVPLKSVGQVVLTSKASSLGELVKNDEVPIDKDDPSAGKATALFYYKTGGGWHYGTRKNNGKEVNLYCMVEVMPRFEMDFDKINKAGNFNIKYEIRKP